MKKVLYIGFFVVLSLSCQKEEGVNPVDNPYVYSGGEITVFDHSSNAFGFVNPRLDDTEELLFFVGNSFFKQSWVTAPSSTTARDGLGPLFNARSCSSCHIKDGKGVPKLESGNESVGFLVRISQSGMTDEHGGPLPHLEYGGQLQEESVLNDGGEGSVQVDYEYKTVYYADGTSKTLRKPIYTVLDQNGQPITGIDISPRVGQHMIGLGLLEAINENDITAYANSETAQQFQVSGRPNYVYSVAHDQMELGRFGWKANQPTIRQQVAAALNGDLGIKTGMFPQENHTALQTDYENLTSGGDPEIEDDDFEKLVLYSSNLAVPARRNYDDEDVKAGAEIFKIIGCTSCHRTAYHTGVHEEFPSLSNQLIYPYTDMLLHDMGEGLADHRADYGASGSEWRTAPLWGIGLIETVNNHTYFLHDGRARDIEEAILWHGGEAETIKNTFINLDAKSRDQVLQFLNSL